MFFRELPCTPSVTLNVHSHRQEEGQPRVTMGFSLAQEGCHLQPTPFMVTPRQGVKELYAAQQTNDTWPL